MKYKVQDSDEVVDGEILEKLSKDEYKIKIKDNEYVVKILHTDSNVMEFVLNNEFHSVRYVDSQTSEMNFIVDGSSMSVNICLLYTSPSPRDRTRSRMPSSA